MKTNFLLLSVLIFVNTNAQSFKKGSFLISISEGSTKAQYSTNNTNNTKQFCSSKLDGIRDPLFIEYGITKRWGIGLSTGNDLFNINPNQFYGFNTNDGKDLNVKTSEFTFDLNYHVFSSKRTDISIYSSIGSFGVDFSAKSGENTYNYNASGGIVRFGTKFRYYFWKRLGIMAMLSTYSGTANPDKNLKFGELSAQSTTISGTATEFGLCFRLR